MKTIETKPAKFDNYERAKISLQHSVDRNGRHIWRHNYDGRLMKKVVRDEILAENSLTVDEYLACEKYAQEREAAEAPQKLAAIRAAEIAFASVIPTNKITVGSCAQAWALIEKIANDTFSFWGAEYGKKVATHYFQNDRDKNFTIEEEFDRETGKIHFVEFRCELSGSKTKIFIEADINDEISITNEAFNVAVDAEIELANKAETAKFEVGKKYFKFNWLTEDADEKVSYKIESRTAHYVTVLCSRYKINTDERGEYFETFTERIYAMHKVDDADINDEIAITNEAFKVAVEAEEDNAWDATYGVALAEMKKPEIVKFEVGKRYWVSPEKKYTIKIVKRAAKSVKFIDGDPDPLDDEIETHRIKIDGYCETFSVGNPYDITSYWVDADDVVDEVAEVADEITISDDAFNVAVDAETALANNIFTAGTITVENHAEALALIEKFAADTFSFDFADKSVENGENVTIRNFKNDHQGAPDYKSFAFEEVFDSDTGKLKFVRFCNGFIFNRNPVVKIFIVENAEPANVEVITAEEKYRRELKADGYKFILATRTIAFGEGGKQSVQTATREFKKLEQALKAVNRHIETARENPAHDGGYTLTDIDGNPVETVDPDIAKFQARFDDAKKRSEDDNHVLLKINGEQIDFRNGKLAVIFSPKLNSGIRIYDDGRKGYNYRGFGCTQTDFRNRLAENYDSETALERLDEYESEWNEIWDDIINTKEILRRAIVNGEPKAELERLANYIAERFGEARDLKANFYKDSPSTTFDEFKPDDFDGDAILKEAERDIRFDKGDEIAAQLTAKLREIEPNVAVTFDIDEYGKDKFKLKICGENIYFGTSDSPRVVEAAVFEHKIDKAMKVADRQNFAGYENAIFNTCRRLYDNISFDERRNITEAAIDLINGKDTAATYIIRRAELEHQLDEAFQKVTEAHERHNAIVDKYNKLLENRDAQISA